MRIVFSPEFRKDLKKLKRKDIRITKRAQKQLKLFASNPKHRSLRIHKLTGHLKGYWSLSVTKSIRIIYQLRENDMAYFVQVGTHDDVYEN